jgi:hypothetical protein
MPNCRRACHEVLERFHIPPVGHSLGLWVDHPVVDAWLNALVIQEAVEGLAVDLQVLGGLGGSDEHTGSSTEVMVAVAR